MTLRLLLVRHGLSSFNHERRIQGRTDLSTLTEKGKQQAKETGKALAELPIDAVYSSPLKRAADTTNNLVKHHNSKLTPIFDEGLIEVDLGPWSGLKIDEVEEKFPVECKTWRENPTALAITRDNGSKYEPIKDLINQSQNFLKKILRDHSPENNKTILLVAHNAILRCLIIEIIGGSNLSFRKLQLDNASLSIFNIKPDLLKSYKVQIECLNNTSHLNDGLPLNKKKSRLILIRHGETNWNKQGRFQGQIDIPLNENGLAQAKAAAKFLSKIEINKAYSSSMLRPIQTAKEILEFHPKVKIETKKELIEIGHGLWEGKLESEIKEDWPDLLLKWKSSPEEVQMPEGENIKEVWERSIKCWENICKDLEPNQTALIVAHDAVNKTILCKLLGLNASDIWMIKQGNGGVTIIDISKDPSQPDVVTCLNLTSHLGGVLDTTAEGAL